MGEELKVGDWVRYVGLSENDLTNGWLYEVINVYRDGEGTVRVSDDVGDGHDLYRYEYELSDTRNPDWIVVFQEGDEAPDGGQWASLTVFDNDTQWYCYRTSKFHSGLEGSIAFQHNSPATKEPLDAVRAAAMLLVFADEEAKL
ncbi:hypothetical protein [Vibrio cholerae]|uniref:hypothetical protein n=1 Tax=Vibrio cholerae TaxID=666 RepID=UPI00053C21A2|nr:hypothetical protein [Vibrio cholerae]